MIISQCIKFHNEQDQAMMIERRTGPSPPDFPTQEWEQVLNNAKREQDIQDYLEHHPELLPGVFDLHNGPLHDVVISKFPFGADFKCDFAFLTRNSMQLQFTFIEIEDPNRPIFNKDGSFTQEFNHARQQIADWRVWADKNIYTVMDMFSPMFKYYPVENDSKDFRFYLIYGRRSEAEMDKKRKERWSSLRVSADLKSWIMTYDRLRFCKECHNKLIVCSYQDRSFYAKSNLI
jgi:hypothetical protein